MTENPVPIFRSEADSLGSLQVPANAYYGVQTLRAARNFSISGATLSQFPVLIAALGSIKLAAARANLRLGDLSPECFRVIELACQDVIAGKLDDQFIVDVYQGGAGTSTNMNANEVIANRALEHLGLPRGRYDVIHPNNHINLSQSTNDVYPTAMRLALLRTQPELARAITLLSEAFEQRSVEFRTILKLGRTQLQDAVPMTLGQEFGAFAATLREDVLRLDEAARLMLEINLGGTAIGTGITADPAYAALVVEELSRQTNLPFISSSNLIEACWDTGAYVTFSSVLKRTSTKLSKIANDLRLLSSGPRGGFGEISLPARQPGSSIMPGKVNPVIPEAVNQVAFQVIGYDLTVTLAAEAGQLQLNAMEPVIIYSILQSARLLTSVIDVLRENCVAGITANLSACETHLAAGTALATALVPLLGYERAAELAKQVLVSGIPITRLIEDCRDVPAETIAQLSEIETLVYPSRMRRLVPTT